MHQTTEKRMVAREPGPKKSKLSFSFSLAGFAQFPFCFFWWIFGFLLLHCKFGMTPSCEFERTSLSRDLLGNSMVRFIVSSVHWEQLLNQVPSPKVFSHKTAGLPSLHQRWLQEIATLMYKVKNGLVLHYISSL